MKDNKTLATMVALEIQKKGSYGDCTNAVVVAAMLVEAFERGFDTALESEGLLK